MFGMGTGISSPPWPPAYYACTDCPPAGTRVTPAPERRPKGRKRHMGNNSERQYGQASRPISTARLCASPRLHLRPIDRMFSPGASGACAPWTPHPGAGFPLRCFQRLSLPGLATLRLPLAGQQVRQRPVRLGPLVLKAAPLGRPAPATDRDRTVSRRSEPSSRTALTSRCQTFPSM